jgi:hypothetical protein
LNFIGINFAPTQIAAEQQIEYQRLFWSSESTGNGIKLREIAMFGDQGTPLDEYAPPRFT